MFRLRSICAFGLALVPAILHAQESGPEFLIEYSGDPNAIIIEYDVDLAIERAEDVPLLRVYADGRVHVHRQIYVPDAGDYEMRLSPQEVEGLLTLLHENGVLTFDPVRVKEDLKAARSQRALTARSANQPVTHRSDVGQSVLRVRLAVYQPSRNAPRQLNVDKEVRCVDLQHDAEEFPEVETLRGVADAENALKSLATDPRLRKVEARR